MNYSFGTILESIVRHKIGAYILYDDIKNMVGVVTDKKIALKWNKVSKYNSYEMFIINDPELLNRIAKEGKNANKT